MPALLTHCIYGDKVLLSNGVDVLNRIIRQNIGAYYLGCQGPDVLMYYHCIPIYKNNQEINKLGCDLHGMKVNELLGSLIKQAKETNDESLIAYCCGFFCHHSIDSKTHPYIMYCSDSAKNPQNSEHVVFEAKLDYEVLCNNNITLKEYKTKNLLKCDRRSKTVISKAFAKALEESVGFVCEAETVYTAFRNMRQSQVLLYDPAGIKYKLVKWLEKTMRKRIDSAEAIIPLFHDDKYDVMNYRGDVWCNPADNSTFYTSSFVQLGEEAVQVCCSLLVSFHRYLFEKGSIEDALELVGNRSYETGLPIEQNRKQIYFKKDM